MHSLHDLFVIYLNDIKCDLISSGVLCVLYVFVVAAIVHLFMRYLFKLRIVNCELRREDKWNEKDRNTVAYTSTIHSHSSVRMYFVNKKKKRSKVICSRSVLTGFFGIQASAIWCFTRIPNVYYILVLMENLFGISRMRYLCASTMNAIEIF